MDPSDPHGCQSAQNRSRTATTQCGTTNSQNTEHDFQHFIEKSFSATFRKMHPGEQIDRFHRNAKYAAYPTFAHCASGSRTRQLDARGHCTVISAPMSVLARLPVVSWTSVENANMSRRLFHTNRSCMFTTSHNVPGSHSEIGG